jgi:hypothetical protein
MELAQLVLRADGAPVAEATVQRLAQNPRATRELALAGRVRVRIEYRLTEVAADSLTLHPDVYGKAGSRYAARIGEELRAQGAAADADSAAARFTNGRGPGTALTIARAAALPEREPVLAVGASVAAVGMLQP